MKRILYTIPNVETAGSGKALLNLARGVKDAGWEVHILMLHTRGELAKLMQKEFTVHEAPYLSPLRPFHSLFKNTRRTARIFKSIAPNLIHSFNYMAEYSEGLAAFWAGIPWVFTKKNMSWRGLAYRQWRVRSWLASAIVIQNSDMLREFYPGQKKVALIPRGVYFDHFAEAVKASKKKAGSRVIITVAHLVPVKGLEDLLTAFEQLGAAHQGWELWVVGDTQLHPDYTTRLKAQIAAAGLEKQVLFWGKRSDVRPYLAAAEILVLPTRNEGRKEGSPLATLEAMAAGLVVLGASVPGVRDQLKKFPQYLFPPGSPDELAGALAPLLTHTPAQNKALGAQLQKWAQEHSQLSSEVDAHLEVYNKWA